MDIFFIAIISIHCKCFLIYFKKKIRKGLVWKIGIMKSYSTENFGLAIFDTEYIFPFYAAMNYRGEEGWELVQMLQLPNGYRALFKKAKILNEFKLTNMPSMPCYYSTSSGPRSLSMSNL